MEKFIVSARKYRPITFESVVGQEHITSTLKNAVARKQLAHAYLFCGPRGVGKTTCARILSKTINCFNLSDDFEPCNKCESCVAFNDNRSFNIHELDAASNNSVEYIRQLTEQVRILPQVGKYSVYIIDEAHMLSTAAFNAFLKTLEEPPAHAIFILATTEKHKILPTIISRCQIYDFKRIRVEDIVSYLSLISSNENVIFDDESLHIIASKADGCMRDALSMYDKVVSFCGESLKAKEVAEALNVLDYDSYFNFTVSFTTGDYKSALIQFDEILQKGFESQIFMAGLSIHLRNILVAADPKTLPLLEVTGEVAKRYSDQAKSVPISMIFDALNVISIAEQGLKSSLNVRLHTEIAILKLCNLSPAKLSSKLPNDDVVSLPANTSIEQKKNDVVSVKNTQSVDPIYKEEVKKENNHVDAINEDTVIKPKTRKRSGSVLGLSINNIINSDNESEILKVNNTDNIKTESKFIDSNNVQKVINGCKSYAKILSNSRPRLSVFFENCIVKDGQIVVTVPNNILKDELIVDQHLIIEELSKLCGNIPLSFIVEVDESIEQSKIVLIKDDDKLKFLVEQNPLVAKIFGKLDLDYI